MSHRYAVIMAGGKGERFWPQSRLARPKQLLPIVGDAPMLAQTVERLRGLVAPEQVIVITNREQRAAALAPMPSGPSWSPREVDEREVQRLRSDLRAAREERVELQRLFGESMPPLPEAIITLEANVRAHRASTPEEWSALAREYRALRERRPAQWALAVAEVDSLRRAGQAAESAERAREFLAQWRSLDDPPLEFLDVMERLAG